MKYSRWIVLAIVFFVQSTVLAVSKKTRPADNTLNAKCLLVKKSYLDDEALNMTFTKRPSVPAPGKYWILKWRNFSIPIPAVRYSHVSVWQNRKGFRQLMLIRRNNLITVSIYLSVDEIIKDAFDYAIVGEIFKGKPKTHTIKASEAATSKMFGRQMRLSDILMLGYKITPASVTCYNRNLKVELVNMYVLNLKATATLGTILAVHKGVGVYSGWMKKEFVHFKKRTPKHIYNLYITRQQNPDILFNFGYRLPVSSSFHSLPYLIGGKKLVSNSKPPQWFISLNRALKTETRKDWDQYIVDARKAKIDEKNIQSLIDDLNKAGDLNK